MQVRETVLALATAVVLCSIPARGQTFCVPTSEMGQFSQPFGPFPAMMSLDLHEIAHAVVLPPPASDPDQVRVLFMCRSDCTDFPLNGGRSFIWKPLARPGLATEIVMPQPDGIGSSDGFCSGHTVAADGSVIVGGGLNFEEKCNNPAPCIQQDPGPDETNTPVGHKWVYKLDTSASTPVWAHDLTWPALMQRERWYPNLTVLNDGTIGIYGHYGAPNTHCPVPAWPYGSSPDIPFFREVFTPSAGVSSAFINLINDTSGVCDSSPTQTAVGDYPRIHLLSTGQLLQVDGENTAPGMSSRIMNLRNAPCGGSDLRWDDVVGASQPSFTVGGSSVHYVLLDSTSFTGLRDVVYYVGGISAGDDVPCQSASTITSQTWRFKDADALPQVGTDDVTNADWEPMASMSHRRVNQNAVLLPTGSLLVVGGTDETCTAVLEAEEFLPPEVYGGTIGEWRGRDSHLRPRQYHSVAFLLPDGRVCVAGGTAPDGYYDIYHTVEIFAPWYYFMGVRPVITGSPDPVSVPIGFGVPFLASVTLDCNSTNYVERVVLLRSCSPTHAFDMNQRYVELSFVPTGAYPNITLTVTGPRDGYAAPPGYYLLFVVDKYGVPSEGRWVRVQ